MKTKVFFLVLVSMLSVWTGFAQEAHYYEAHRHSVTVSTGYPFVLAMMYPPGHQNNSMTMDGRRVGVSARENGYDESWIESEIIWAIDNNVLILIYR